MRRVAALVLSLAVFAACDGGDKPARTERAAVVGRRPPTFTTTDLAGKRVRLADFRGQTVIVNFWASWCTPCRHEFPLLAELDARPDVTVLGVVFNDTVANARKFMAEHGARWSGLRDNGSIAKAYRVGPGIPATIVVNPQGIVSVRHLGEFTRADELLA